LGKFFIPSNGPEDWKNFLAEPDKQWRSGYSAKALAYCWEEAQGFPDSVKQVFQNSSFPVLQEIEFLFGFPEHKVSLPSGSRPSQNDIFVLGRSQGQFISIAVEGKVSEPFGPTVFEWNTQSSPGKERRLSYLCDLLGISIDRPKDIRYQLLHRTASALIEAERFGASCAIMLVHSFSQLHEWLEDYYAFLSLYGKNGDANSVTLVGERNGIELYLSWVTGEKRYLEI